METLIIFRNDRRCIILPSVFDDICLPKLRTLAVRDYTIEDNGIVEMIKTATLVKLDLSKCEIEESLLLKITRACPRLKELNLSISSMTPITDDILSAISTTCSQIAHLNICDAYDVTDAGILTMVQNLKGLQSLNIIEAEILTDGNTQTELEILTIHFAHC